MPRTVQLAVAVTVLLAGAYLVAMPQVVADALDRPHATVGDQINLRASWGGVVVGLGGFLAWVTGVRPWTRTITGLLGWLMAGVGLARLVGFALDGAPDARQVVWITAEVALVIACEVVLRRGARAARG